MVKNIKFHFLSYKKKLKRIDCIVHICRFIVLIFDPLAHDNGCKRWLLKICFIFAAARIFNWLMRPLKVVLYCFHFFFFLFSWSCTIYSIFSVLMRDMYVRHRRRFWWIECDLTAHTFSSFIHANDVLYEFLYFFIRLLSYLCLSYIPHSLLIIIHLWHINLLYAIKDQNSMSNKMTEMRWAKSVKC